MPIRLRLPIAAALVPAFAALAGAGQAPAGHAAYTAFTVPLPIPKVLNGTEGVPGTLACRAVRGGNLCRLHCPEGYALTPAAKGQSTVGGPCRPQRIRRVRISIRQADIQILPGAKTSMWTFDGTFPGPTIRVPSGRPLYVTFANQLDASKPLGDGSVTIHLHGGHSPEAMDGQPHDYFVDPGESREYRYPLRENGSAERGAFQWYHDHLHEHAERNVWRGLAGMFVLEDAYDASLPLPKGKYDVPLMLLSRSFDEANQLADHNAPGDVELVNGAPQPYLDVEPRKYRLRLLNADARHVYKLSVRGFLTETVPQDPIPPDALRGLRPSAAGDAAGARADFAVTMTRIATESGLIPKPQALQSLELGPAERGEVVVDFAPYAHLGDLVLRDETSGKALLQFRIASSGGGAETSSVPDHLRNLPFLLQAVAQQVTREWTFQGTATINGESFAAGRIDAQPSLSRIERWRFSDGNEGHPVHVHGADFVVVSPASHPDYGLLKETVMPRGTVEVLIRFSDHAGRFVLHCHILGHEDKGMMAQLRIVPGRHVVTGSGPGTAVAARGRPPPG